MPAGNEPTGAGADPARDVHEDETVVHARDADFESRERQENASPAPRESRASPSSRTPSSRSA